MVKVVLIGIDAAIPTLVQKYFEMGMLPNMKKLSDEGTWAECIPVFPTHTASNWNSVATGAWPKTHGVTDMVVHLPGTPLTEIKSGFWSDLCQAEQIWKTAERFDKKSILLKYISSWPPNIEKGIQVEGFGAPGGPGSRPWGSSPISVSNSACYSTEQLENATVINFSESNLSSWKNIPNELSHRPALETQIRIGPIGGVNYNILLVSNSSGTYDSVLITKSKDAKAGFFLKRGELTNWITENFNIDGKIIPASFRMKLIDLGKNEKPYFKLFVTQVFPVEGWTFPNDVAKDLVKRFGPFLESISHFPYVFGWIDEYTYLDDVSYQAEWMGRSADYLMSKYDWNLFMTQWHGVDNTQHAFLRFDKSVLTEYEAEVCDRVTLRAYQIADKLVQDIVQATNHAKKKYEDVYTFVLSDHGHVMGKRRFFINGYLYEKGLIKLKKDSLTKKITVDWENTQAFAQGMVHVYVNLKGREPVGAVEPGKNYDDVVKKLIDVLLDVKDPVTGVRPLSLVLSNQDAEFLGLSGDRAGDVIFAANPVYAIDNRVKTDGNLFADIKVGFRDGSIHGAQLPSVDLGEYGTIKSMFIAHGPKIKKGRKRKKPISIIDVAPTIAHILNIPSPKDCEGAIMYDLFE